MKLKKFIVLGVIVLCSVCLFACSNTGNSSNNNEKSIGIAMPTKSLERWNNDGMYLKSLFEAKGYNVSVVYSDNKVEQQVKDIEELISKKVNMLVIAPIDTSSLKQVLKDAKDMNIPVISYDRLILDTDAVSYYVSFDNYKVGQLQGQYILDKLNLKDPSDKSKTYNMELLEGDIADTNSRYVYDGAMDVLKDYIDSGVIKIPSNQVSLEQSTTKLWDTTNAMTRLQNILATNYSDGTQLDICLCANDSLALGATKAIESDYAGKNKVIITGQDGDEANLANIIDEKQSMTVYKALKNLTTTTVAIADFELQGKKADEELIKNSNFGFDCQYDSSNFNNGKVTVPSFLLKPIVITKDNIQKELIDTGYYAWNENHYPKVASY